MTLPLRNCTSRFQSNLYLDRGQTQGHSCGTRTSNVGNTWEVVRNSESGVHSRPLNQNLHFNKLSRWCVGKLKCEQAGLPQGHKLNPNPCYPHRSAHSNWVVSGPAKGGGQQKDQWFFISLTLNLSLLWEKLHALVRQSMLTVSSFVRDRLHIKTMKSPWKCIAFRCQCYIVSSHFSFKIVNSIITPGIIKLPMTS